MNDRVDEFLAVYNRLHEAMRERLNDATLSFGDACNRLRSDKLLRRYMKDLDRIREIRNYISHEHTDSKITWITPSEEMVALSKKILEDVTVPPTVALLKKKQLLYFRETSLLKEVLETIERHSVTQFPIFSQNEFKGMLSENGIAQWLAGHRSKNDFQIDQVTVSDLLKHEEKVGFYTVLTTTTSLFELEDELGKHPDYTLLIVETKNIHSPKDIQNIITVYDLPEIQQYTQ